MVLAKPTSLAGKVRVALREQEFTLVLSPQLATEIEDTLHSPFLQAKHDMSDTEIRHLVRDLVHISTMTASMLTLNIPALSRRDPEDIMVIASAVEGKAAYLVTQDKDLLSLKKWEGVRIIEIPEFYRALCLMAVAGQ